VASPNDPKLDARLDRSMETLPRRFKRRAAMIVLGRRFRAQQRASEALLPLPRFWWLRVSLQLTYILIPAVVGGVIGAIHLGIPVTELFSFNFGANNALAPWIVGAGVIGLVGGLTVEWVIGWWRRRRDSPQE
jgi:hypothetical protein